MTTSTTDLPALRLDYLRPYRGNTLGLYNFHLDRFFGWCAAEQIDPLLALRRDIERYIEHLLIDHRLAPASVCTALTPVRGLYRFAHQESLIDRDPAQYARRPRTTSMPKDTVGLDRFQMQSFLLAGQVSGGRYYADAFLLACMALRASEACSLQIENYQKTSRGHRVLEFHGKAGAPARMPVPVPVLRALDAAAGDRATGNLLLRRDGGPLTRQGLGTIINTLGRQAGIPACVRANPTLTTIRASDSGCARVTVNPDPRRPSSIPTATSDFRVSASGPIFQIWALTCGNVHLRLPALVGFFLDLLHQCYIERGVRPAPCAVGGGVAASESNCSPHRAACLVADTRDFAARSLDTRMVNSN